MLVYLKHGWSKKVINGVSSIEGSGFDFLSSLTPLKSLLLCKYFLLQKIFALTPVTYSPECMASLEGCSNSIKCDAIMIHLCTKTRWRMLKHTEFRALPLSLNWYTSLWETPLLFLINRKASGHGWRMLMQEPVSYQCTSAESFAFLRKRLCIINNEKRESSCMLLWELPGWSDDRISLSSLTSKREKTKNRKVFTAHLLTQRNGSQPKFVLTMATQSTHWHK